jgi:hypothetical protein
MGEQRYTVSQILLWHWMKVTGQLLTLAILFPLPKTKAIIQEAGWASELGRDAGGMTKISVNAKNQTQIECPAHSIVTTLIRRTRTSQ